MTREEAIKILTEYFDGGCTDFVWDAYQLAIKALQAQGDMISRTDAIDTIKNNIMPTKEGFYEPCEVFEALNELPPAQPEYEPVKAEDFARTMSKNTIYGFVAWYGEALRLMERYGFVICKKKM